MSSAKRKGKGKEDRSFHKKLNGSSLQKIYFFGRYVCGRCGSTFVLPFLSFSRNCPSCRGKEKIMPLYIFYP